MTSTLLGRDLLGPSFQLQPLKCGNTLTVFSILEHEKSNHPETVDLSE